MDFLPRPGKDWPYALSSTARPRGTLRLGALVGSVQVYEAVGEARTIYMDTLSHEVVMHLNDNADDLHESGSSFICHCS